jgi:hypothetical protein
MDQETGERALLVSEEVMPDSIVWQRFWRVERVTGIEPALELGKYSCATVFSCPAGELAA